MSALADYLLKRNELSGFIPDSREHDSVLEEMDDLWWKLSKDERKITESAGQMKWIVFAGHRYCPFCGTLLREVEHHLAACHACEM